MVSRIVVVIIDVLNRCCLFGTAIHNQGTVWQLVGKIDGVGEALQRLQRRGKKIVYVTNNSLRSDDEYRSKFQQSGITARVEDVMHPALATVHFLQREAFKGLVYTIGSPVFRQTIADAGFQTIDGVCDRGAFYFV